MIRPFAIVPCLVIVAMAGLALAQTPPSDRPNDSPVAAESRAPAAVVTLHNEINSYSQSVLVRDFARARAAGAKVVIIDLNTYGGAVPSALELSHFIKQQSDIHTIAYVNSKAYSAGAMLALACDEIVVAPVAALGDCAPIAVGPTGMMPLPPAERAKSESPILSDFEDSAVRNGYDPLLAQSMVAVGRVVHWIEKEGQRQFVDAQAYAKLVDEGWTPVPGVANPVDREDTLLTVNGDQAIKLGLATGQAASVEELIQQRNLNPVAVFRPGLGHDVLDFLNNAAVRSALLMIFLTSLYAALHAPGHGFPEALAVLALAGLLGVPLMTGYAQWWEILAVLIGIGLLAVEIFVIPGFGVAGLAGITLILVGLTMTFVAPEPGRSPLTLPHLPMTWAALQQGLLVVVSGLLASMLLSWWLSRYLPQLPYLNKLILTTTVGSETPMVGSLTNIDPNEMAPAVGATGLAVTDLRPGGSAQFTDAAGGRHMVSVVSDSGFVTRGTLLIVREVAGNRIVVRPAEQAKMSKQEL